MFTFALAMPILVILFCFYMLYRNEVVFNYRMSIVDSNLDCDEWRRRLDSIPDYGEMIWQLFTFNWDHCWNGDVK